MGLIGNHSILNKSSSRKYGGSSTAIAFHSNNKSSNMSTSILRARGQLQFKQSSIPGTGYSAGYAFMIPMKTGELGARRVEGVATVTASGLSAMIAVLNAITGTSTVTGNANAIGLITISGTSDGVATVTANTLVASSMSGTIAGVATILANLGAVIPCSITIAGAASVAANLKGTGRLGGTISIGASGYLSNDDVERLSEAVWDIVVAEHATAGTTGKALADAGGAGNPWAADTSTNNDPNTFGEKVNDLLTKNQFLGLKD